MYCADIGRIPDELSTKMLEKYVAEQKALVDKTAELKKSEIQADKEKNDVDEFISRLTKYYDAPCPYS
ncbi:MAG: hypothetical protein K2N27_03595 [Ruminococcus sp.]|nr:hypothetical protein [Ruminococcus sp.]